MEKGTTWKLGGVDVDGRPSKTGYVLNFQKKVLGGSKTQVLTSACMQK
jgi:hypothetical protein